MTSTYLKIFFMLMDKNRTFILNILDPWKSWSTEEKTTYKVRAQVS